MLNTYFTVLHWASFIGFILLFIISMIFAILKADRANILPIGIFAFFGCGIGFLISIFGIDESVKKCEITNIEYKRMLANESLIVQGRVKNIGEYPVAQCIFELRVSAGALNKSMFGKGEMFSPMSGFFGMFSNEKEEEKKVMSIREEYIITRNLNPGIGRDFTITIPFPPHFTQPLYGYKLNCK